MDAINYKQGLIKLRTLVQQQTPVLISDFYLLEYRLHDVLSQQQRYGPSQNNDVERYQVIDQLMQFTMQHFALQFIDLCRDDSDNNQILSSEIHTSDPTLSYPSTIWQEGDEIRVHDTSYILRAPLNTPTWVQDDNYLYQQVLAIQVGNGRKVWLKQVRVHSASTPAKTRRDALMQEGHLLSTVEQETQAFPKVISSAQSRQEVTLVHTVSPGLSYLQTFGASGQALPATRVRSFFQAMLSLCTALEALHHHGYTHRFLTPTTIFMADNRQVRLQDIGIATLPYTAGEGPDGYRAPEQATHPSVLAVPGPYTDIYQIGKIIYFIVCGRTGTFSQPLPPLSLWNQAIAPEIDAVLIKAIEPDPKNRWQSLRQFSSALRRALQTSTQKKEQS